MLKKAKENKNGRNTHFLDTKANIIKTRKQIVDEIKKGLHSKYYIRKINGVDTPVAKPNGKKKDNLE